MLPKGGGLTTGGGVDISHLFYAGGVDAAHRIARDLKDALLLTDDTDAVVEFISEFDVRTMAESATGLQREERLRGRALASI
jgi:hypothetical protein